MMRGLGVLAAVVAFAVWIVLQVAADRDQRHLSDAELRGDLANPWVQEHPVLTGLGTGLIVLVGGSVVVVAITTDRR